MRIFSLLFSFLIASCSIAPGMQAPSNSFGGSYVQDIDGGYVKVKKIDYQNNFNFIKQQNYEFTVTSGDILTIIIWGQQEVFPVTPSFNNNPQNSRQVSNDGKIFFPYVGEIFVNGLTVSEVRELLIEKLSEKFIQPQVDVSVTKFSNQRNIYVLGEVTRPQTMSLGVEPITLADALGKVNGLNNNSSKGEEVYIIRVSNDVPEIFNVNMKDAGNFILASQIYLEPKDIVYVGAANITKWNRVIAQFFPFASFLNAVENINSN